MSNRPKPPCVNCITLSICRNAVLDNQEDIQDGVHMILRQAIHHCPDAKDYLYINEKLLLNTNTNKMEKHKTYSNQRADLIYEYFLFLNEDSFDE